MIKFTICVFMVVSKKIFERFPTCIIYYNYYLLALVFFGEIHNKTLYPGEKRSHFDREHVYQTNMINWTRSKICFPLENILFIFNICKYIQSSCKLLI